MTSPPDPPDADDRAHVIHVTYVTPNVSQDQFEQGTRAPNRAIADFQRRLFELTPHAITTLAIVAANVVVFVLMAVSSGTLLSPGHETLIAWGSNFGQSTLDGQWWRLLTCMFVHIGIIHIGFNMLVLWNAGPLVERLVGNAGFLVVYIVSGLCGSMASVCWNPHVNSAGASGAVFGVFGALIGFIILRGDSVPKSILGSLRSSGLGFVAINLAIGFSIRWIDNAAHIGGLAAGFVCGVLMSHPLDRATKTSRGIRNLLTAAVGTAALLGAAYVAPQAPIDVPAAEQKVLDTYFNNLQRWERREITSEEFADIVESKVLPDWHVVKQALDEMPDSALNRSALLRQYARAREEEWQALVARLRDPTDANVSEHKKKQDAVVQLVDQLKSQ